MSRVERLEEDNRLAERDALREIIEDLAKINLQDEELTNDGEHEMFLDFVSRARAHLVHYNRYAAEYEREYSCMRCGKDNSHGVICRECT